MFHLKRFKKYLFLILIFGLAFPGYGDGFIVIPRPPHPRPPYPLSPFPLEVAYHQVNVTINDQFATTSIDQEFYNPTNWRLEGYYLFPIPKNATIKKFSMFVNGRELEAELLDATKARRIYEDIVRRQMDPALLEYGETGVFKVRIFPIEPGSRKRVKISYHELLQRDNNTIGYLYPLNTEKFSAKPLNNVNVNVEIQSSGEIKNIYCPTHKVEIVSKGKSRAIVAYEERNVRPDMDYKLYFTTDIAKLGFSVLSYQKKGEDGHFFLSLSPGLELKDQETVKKDITFVLDVSGSMAGEKLKQAKKALLFCIENLNPGDRFEVIRFSTEAESLFGRLNPLTQSSRDQARRFINDLRAIGGTNIDEALGMALKQKTAKGRPHMIVFITDGKPTIGETDEANLLQKIKDSNITQTRIFTFGIGHEINTHLLDKMTEMTRAFRSYISPEEDIELEISNFYTKIQSPVLTDLKLSFTGNVKVSKIYPLELGDLFKGSALSIFGRYRGNGPIRIVLEGKIMERSERFDYDVTDGFKSAGSPDSEKNDFIPPLWGARRIGYLLDQIRLHGKDDELINEIIDLARTYGIVTPHTSFLIVEDEKSRLERNEIRLADQTLAPAAGRDRGFEEKNREEFRSLEKKSGSQSVRVSEEFQALNQAANLPQMRQGKSRLDYIDGQGRVQNITQQVRNIQGRAMYYNGEHWVDSTIQNQKFRKNIRIQFASEAYFELLRNQPETGQFLALGKNIRFVSKDNLYEIYE